MSAILRLLPRWGARSPYFDIHGDDGSLYMGRWWLFGSEEARDAGKTTVGLHHIAREDRARDFHTHPCSFITIVVAGWYRERRPLHQLQDYAVDQTRHFDIVRRPGSIAFRRADERHTIIEVSPGGAWTVVIWFRKQGSWGFATRNGFVNWRRYKVSP